MFTLISFWPLKVLSNARSFFLKVARSYVDFFPHVLNLEKINKVNMALNLEILVGTYEEFLLGYRIRPSRSVSKVIVMKFMFLLA